MLLVLSLGVSLLVVPWFFPLMQVVVVLGFMEVSCDLPLPSPELIESCCLMQAAERRDEGNWGCEVEGSRRGYGSGRGAELSL